MDLSPQHCQAHTVPSPESLPPCPLVPEAFLTTLLTKHSPTPVEQQTPSLSLVCGFLFGLLVSLTCRFTHCDSPSPRQILSPRRTGTSVCPLSAQRLAQCLACTRPEALFLGGWREVVWGPVGCRKG